MGVSQAQAHSSSSSSSHSSPHSTMTSTAATLRRTVRHDSIIPPAIPEGQAADFGGQVNDDAMSTADYGDVGITHGDEETQVSSFTVSQSYMLSRNLSSLIKRAEANATTTRRFH